MSLNKAMIIGNLGRDPEMRYTPEWPGRHPVHGRRQPQLQGPERRVAGRDRVVPRRRLGPAGRARRRVPAQGQQGLHRGPPPDPPVGRPGRPEALHHRAGRQPGHHLERRDPRRGRRPGPGPAARLRPARQRVRRRRQPARRPDEPGPATSSTKALRRPPVLTDRTDHPTPAEDTGTRCPRSSSKSQEARRLLPRPAPAQGLRLLRRQDGPDRLQGGQPPPPLPVRARQDRAAPQDRHLRRPPARAVGRAQARPPRRPAAVRAAAPSPLMRGRARPCQAARDRPASRSLAGSPMTDASTSLLVDRLRRHPRRRRALHQRHRVVRPPADLAEGAVGIGAGGRRHGAPGDDDPARRDRLRGRGAQLATRWASAPSWVRRSCSRRWRCS